MVAIVSQGMTLTEYLAYQSENDTTYELDNGELLEMPPESDINQRIASFLLIYFAQLGVSSYCLRIGAEIVVTGSNVSVRVPDLMVLSEDTALALEGAKRSTITLEMPPPELVIEVVSPGRENIERDYRYKRSQYQARGINEYWIVDPLTEKVTVLTMNRGLYDEAIFASSEQLVSAFLQQNNAEEKLIVSQILQK
ncbi:MAG: Uma2 family endonuclease [Limnothrix sp.]